jgi:hypothetical protein
MLEKQSHVPTICLRQEHLDPSNYTAARGGREAYVARRHTMRSTTFLDPELGAAGRQRRRLRDGGGGGWGHGAEWAGKRSKGEEGWGNGGVADWRWRRRGQGSSIPNGDGNGL